MDFGFVGSEREWWRVKLQFDAQRDHRLIAILLDSVSPAAGQFDGSVRKYSDFEELLTASLDALILGVAVANRADRLRRIAQYGRSCLCFPAAESDAILLDEVAMLAADSHTVLVPWLPARLHPAWHDLLSRCTANALGVAKSVLIERSGPLPTGRELVASCYAEAVDLLAPMIGEIVEVTATGEASAARLVVQHRTANGLAGEIRLAPASTDSDCCRITVELQRGKAELAWEAGLDGPATLRWGDDTGDHEIVRPAPAPDQGILAEFARAVKGDPHALDWSDSIRAAELADAAWLSLERRRSVDVFQEKRNELASFKGRMTSLGCGLIWFTLFMLIVISAAKGLQIPGIDWLAIATVLVWVLFLGMQALRWVFPAGDNPPERHGPFGS